MFLYNVPMSLTSVPHYPALYLTVQKIETVERHLQVGAKHVEAYYEAYLEKHIDVSTRNP